MSRKIVVGIALFLVAASCDGAPTSSSASAPGLLLERTPSPYTQVTAGSVSALIPDRWEAIAFPGAGREGFVASPEPEAWRRVDGSVAGIAAMWVDATRVGVPSDYYYLVANGSSLRHLTGSGNCRAVRQRIYVDHQPGFMSGAAGSPGDYVARASGVCVAESGGRTRWTFFVAAPGYGPVRSVGIPSSGLYVVVAVLEHHQRSHVLLRRLVNRTRFGGTRVADLIAAVNG